MLNSWTSHEKSDLMQGTACFHCTPSDPPRCHEPRAVSMTSVSRYSATKNYMEPCTVIYVIYLYLFGIYMHWKCGVVGLFGQSPHRVLLLEHPLHAHHLADMKAFVNTLFTLCVSAQFLKVSSHVSLRSVGLHFALVTSLHSGLCLYGPRLRNEIAQWFVSSYRSRRLCIKDIYIFQNYVTMWLRWYWLGPHPATTSSNSLQVCLLFRYQLCGATVSREKSLRCCVPSARLFCLCRFCTSLARLIIQGTQTTCYSFAFDKLHPHMRHSSDVKSQLRPAALPAWRSIIKNKWLARCSGATCQGRANMQRSMLWSARCFVASFEAWQRRRASRPAGRVQTQETGCWWCFGCSHLQGFF